MRYILVDTYNLFFRMRHTANRQATIDDKLGMCMHTMFASANSVIKRLDIDHVVFAVEGGNNWRKTFYKPYKKPRADKLQARTEDEAEEDDLFFTTLNNMIEFIDTKTNCSLIGVPGTEADDVIARFIHWHPDDEHIILSSDTDYYQLINKKVSQFNGVTKEMHTIDGTLNEAGNPIMDKKTQLPKHVGDPEWLLFKKCMRGDKGDNVFSAYPGVREKGTKNKVGLQEAFDDRNKKGYAWNNIMLHRWVDHLEKEHRVLTDYERNRILIDLSQQPEDIIESVDLGIIDVVLRDVIKRMPPNQIGFAFMKFCGQHELVRLAQYPDSIIKWISKPYNGHLIHEQD